MPGLHIDLNEDPRESALNHPVDWDDIVEWGGPAHELDYAMVWNDGIQGAQLISNLDFPCLSSVHDLSFVFVYVFHVIDDEDGGTEEVLVGADGLHASETCVVDEDGGSGDVFFQSSGYCLIEFRLLLSDNIKFQLTVSYVLDFRFFLVYCYSYCLCTWSFLYEWSSAWRQISEFQLVLVACRFHSSCCP